MANIEKLTEICEKYGYKYKENCPLSEYTTFRVGGNCRLMTEPDSADAVENIMRAVRQNGIKYAILGRGSNIIAADEGFDGAILHLGSNFSEIKVEGTYITAQAGAKLSDVCRKAQEHGLTGMENLYGIPGTVGGALYMNAGAYGSEMKDIVESAEYLSEEFSKAEMHVSLMELGYRHSVFAENSDIILSVKMKLEKGDTAAIKAAMDECMQKRVSKQPLEYPSAGSTFKRPEGSYASLLIDRCGLKGLSVGGAQVSEKHGGFVINRGGATCKDILELCGRVRETVREKTGYILELEPIILK